MGQVKKNQSVHTDVVPEYIVEFEAHKRPEQLAGSLREEIARLGIEVEVFATRVIYDGPHGVVSGCTVASRRRRQLVQLVLEWYGEDYELGITELGNIRET